MPIEIRLFNIIKGRMMEKIRIIPYPCHLARISGSLLLKNPLTLFNPSALPEFSTIISDFSARVVSDPGRAQIRLLPVENLPARLARWARQPEGYALIINANYVNICASQPAGHLYGLITLRQLLRQFGPILPALEIADAPVFSRRGAMITFPQGHTAYRPRYMADLVRQLANWKTNELYLYLETYFEFPSIPHQAGPGAMTAEDARHLDKLCQAYNIRLIPQLNLLGHSGEILALHKYQHLMEYGPNEDPRTVRGSNLCASSKETQRFVDLMLRDIFVCFSADIVHVGGDEVSNLGECPRCAATLKKQTKFQLYLTYFDRVRKIALRHGKKIGLWGDMLLQHRNDLNPRDRQKVLAPFTEGAVIYDWHYFGGSPDTLKFFVDAGFETIACSCAMSEYTTALWPAQSVNQKPLFADAQKARAAGGMTTAWYNYMGLHQEQANYMFATNATLLWSGAEKIEFNRDFESAFSLQRYHLKSDTLFKFWHLLGDAKGPVLSSLAPFHGRQMRHYIYQTDNVLTLWKNFCSILTIRKWTTYKKSIIRARILWNKIAREKSRVDDPTFGLQEGPLLTHEHMVRRYEMSLKIYDLYDQAAKFQLEKPALFKKHLNQAADILLRHLKDFPPIERYLNALRRELGMEKSSILRVQAAKQKIRYLADYLRHLSKSKRLLPAFIHLHDTVLAVPGCGWYYNREHEWAEEPQKFRKFSIFIPFEMGGPDPNKE